jgi:hypothetical protein
MDNVVPNGTASGYAGNGPNTGKDHIMVMGFRNGNSSEAQTAQLFQGGGTHSDERSAAEVFFKNFGDAPPTYDSVVDDLDKRRDGGARNGGGSSTTEDRGGFSQGARGGGTYLLQKEEGASPTATHGEGTPFLERRIDERGLSIFHR